MFSYHTLYLLDKQNIMKDSLEVGFGRTSKPCERKKNQCNFSVWIFITTNLTRSTRANNIIKDMIRINTLIYYLLTFICVFKMIMKIKLNFVAVWWEEKSIILLIILWSGSILIKRFVAPVWQQVPVFFELSL